MKTFFLSMLCLSLLLVPARAQSEIIPDVAAQEKASYEGHCGSILYGPNFIRDVDFNNDGLVDAIVSHGEVVCDGKKGTTCKPIGCPYNFYIRVAEGGYLFAANADLYSYDLIKRYGNMVLVLQADGVSCKKPEGETCAMTIRVRGTKFETISRK
ncbi:hypothetical protein [Pararhizobium sp.]|uniref:hypothetical protein n=1 Tax=Pararhizobium sp. TaxID=1977563 RepID=UPI0027266FC5|nr:hypothetical protein [Pararhizobium sp.]MDO9417619.1 hypothetical protein [Pararhizobium sp.]